VTHKIKTVHVTWRWPRPIIRGWFVIRGLLHTLYDQPIYHIWSL